MKSVLILLILALTVYRSYSFDDQTLKYKEKESNSTCGLNADRECKDAGLLCENCHSLVICNMQNNNYTKIPISTCNSAENDKCVENKCTTDPEPICDGTACLPFICTNTGLFPDPFFCDRYHMCVVKSEETTFHETISCEGNYGYNPLTTYCDIDLSSGVCDYPIPLCTEEVSYGSLSTNPSIYYFCEQLGDSKSAYPVQYLCPHGQIFENFNCKNSTDTTNAEDTTITSSTTV